MKYQTPYQANLCLFVYKQAGESEGSRDHFPGRIVTEQPPVFFIWYTGIIALHCRQDTRFTGISDVRCTEDAAKLFHFVQENETAITEALKIVSV